MSHEKQKVVSIATIVSVSLPSAKNHTLPTSSKSVFDEPRKSPKWCTFVGVFLACFKGNTSLVCFLVCFEGYTSLMRFCFVEYFLMCFEGYTSLMCFCFVEYFLMCFEGYTSLMCFCFLGSCVLKSAPLLCLMCFKECTSLMCFLMCFKECTSLMKAIGWHEVLFSKFS
jgi:hypothetical protein